MKPIREGLFAYPLYSYKFSPWRRYIVKRFIPQLGRNIKSMEELESLKEREDFTLLVWGTSLEEEGIWHDKVIRVEDGFIRSVGLGYRLTPPISLVFDSMGIYYDSTKPSELEYVLQNFSFDEDMLQRAERLIQLIKEHRINKYNLEERNYTPPKTDREIVVVPGQVETDRSIKYGSPVVKNNLKLLEEVRKNRPNAYIIYKPHPDVAKGYRKGYYPKDALLEFCDEVCEDVSSISLIAVADEVHTISSLFGFEALLHNKKVVCYGQPFYSSWGLTEDIYPVERRRRKLSLFELVAGSLIIYPSYVSLYNGKKIEPEEAVLELSRLKRSKPLRWRVWGLVQLLLEPWFKLKKW